MGKKHKNKNYNTSVRYMRTRRVYDMIRLRNKDVFVEYAKKTNAIIITIYLKSSRDEDAYRFYSNAFI